jgi:hypothetical protein
VTAGRPLSILLLCDDNRSHAENVQEHIRAFPEFSRHRIQLFNPRGLAGSRFLRLDRFDVVVVHYTIFVLSDAYLAPSFVERLINYDGLKVQFVQDEYRQVDAITARMRELGIGLLYTLVPPDAVPGVYGGRLPGVDIRTTLAGFVPARAMGHVAAPHDRRPLDVVYRGRSVPYWLGRLGQDKILIGQRFLAEAGDRLRCDIAWSEAERIYGDAWYRFLASARATLGTESGASVIDFDGSIEARTNDYLSRHPTASFDDVEEAVLAPYAGVATIRVVSPRVFEAAALRTAMVNFRGDYSGTVEPWIHYVPLEKDFSNVDEVVDAVRDRRLLEQLAGRAHEDLVASGKYSLRRFVREFDDAVSQRAAPRTHRRRLRVSSLAALDEKLSPAAVRRSRAYGGARQSIRRQLGRQLIQGDATAEALLRAARGEPIARERLFDDLVRLVALHRAHAGTLHCYGPQFRVTPHVDVEAREIVFVSTTAPTDDVEAREGAWRRADAALDEGRLQTIGWNHTPVGLALTFPRGPFFSTSLEVGYHVVYGAYRFSALSQLTRTHPTEARAALRPLFEAPAPMVEARPHMSRAIAARGFVALRLALESPACRHLLLRYALDPEARSLTRPDLVLEDLLKLRLLQLAAKGRLPELPVLDVQLDHSGGTARFITCPPGLRAEAVQRNGAHEAAHLEHVVWDHSRVGEQILCPGFPRVRVHIGPRGVYDFKALPALATRLPEEVSAVLQVGETSGGCA